MIDVTPSSALIGGRRIAYGLHGRGDPVALIHGTPSYAFIWRHVAAALAARGKAVLVFDLLGFGRSERPQDRAVDTSVSAQVPMTVALMAHCGFSRAHIVGHDIGGAVAQRLALLHPERVASLSLIDTVSYDSWPSERTKEQMRAGIDRLVRAPHGRHRRHFSDWLESAVVQKDRFRREALGPYLDMISGPVGQASFFQHQVAHYDPSHTLEIADRLHELARHRVQILWGAQDAWQDVGWARRLHADISGSSLHILPDCGHFAMEDDPQAIADVIANFVGEIGEA